MNFSPNSDPWIGRLIGDHQRYRLEKRIGAGGMGDVFLAMDTRLGQQVALKLLKDSLSASQDLRKRFKREVDVSAALASNHIVQIRDSGVTDEGYPFYVMEYLQGESLGQLLRRERRLPVDRTARIVRQVCAGLQIAHQGVTLWRDGGTIREHIKVVHRDLKPDNIFLISTDLGELVKILDFGIAKIRDDAAEYTNLTSTFQGTFRYAAPEQLRVEQSIDGRADIYSLGAILYEMLSGSDPFGFGDKARSTSGVIWGMAHTSKPPQLLRSQPGCEHLPAELEAVVMRCLQKAPEDRFASVEELSQALQSWMTAKGSGAVVKSVDETIAQIPIALTQETVEPTVERPLTPQPAIDLTDVQIPAAPQPKESDRTIAQIPAEQGLRDETNVQVPIALRKTSDHTIAQTSSVQSGSDVTIPQSTSRNRQKSSDVTIAQVNSQQNQPGHNVAVADNRTTSQQHRRLPSHFLLIIGVLTGLLAVGVIVAYIKSQAWQQNDFTQPSSTPPTVDICKDYPESIHCDN